MTFLSKNTPQNGYTVHYDDWSWCACIWEVENTSVSGRLSVWNNTDIYCHYRLYKCTSHTIKNMSTIQQWLQHNSIKFIIVTEWLQSISMQYTSSLVTIKIVEQLHNALKHNEIIKLKTLFKTDLKVWWNYHNSIKCHKCNGGIWTEQPKCVHIYIRQRWGI